MKRILACVMLVLFLFVCASALAQEWECAQCGNSASGNFCSNCGMSAQDSLGFQENEPDSLNGESDVIAADDEIRFQDIPWGTDSETVETKYLPDYEFDSPKHTGGLCVNSILYRGAYWSSQDRNLEDVTLRKNVFGLSVAGYDAKWLTLYYVTTPENNSFDESDHGVLYAASYYIGVENGEAAFEDLVNKISSIYGEPEGEEDAIPGTLPNKDVSRFQYWKGSNGTRLVIYVRLSDTYDDDIFISYAWDAGDQLVFDADAEYKAFLAGEESIIYGNGDTSGL